QLAMAFEKILKPCYTQLFPAAPCLSFFILIPILHSRFHSHSDSSRFTQIPEIKKRRFLRF
ncbi:hypothetical protein, partial [Umezakia ovalisporum]|uniref:hypothetical protein n=1 Tax=Umezakia ovalisporum TaxID=75695 RepID=UPI0039C746AF